MILDEFLVKIATKIEDSSLKKFNESVDSSIKNVLKLGTALSASLGGAILFVQKSLEGLDEIGQLSNVTGEATEAIQELGTIADTNGSSAKSAQQTIAGLSRTIGEAVNGIGLGAKAFEHYGLSVKKANGDVKSTGEVLEDVREKMKGMSEQAQIAMLAKLGITPDMIQVLRLTNEEMEKARENARKINLGTGSKESAKEAMALQDSLTEFWQIIKAVSTYISLQFSPVIRELISVFKEWFFVNNDLIKDNLKGLVKGIGKFFGFVVNLVKAINNVISKTIGWKVVLGAIAGVMGVIAVQSAIAFWPFYAVAGAIGVVIALVDDLLTYMEGGKSLIGTWWDPIISGAKFVWAQFKALWKVIDGLSNIIVGAFTLDDQLLLKGFNKVFDGLKTIFSNIFDVISTPFTEAFSFISSNFERFISYVSSLLSPFSGVWQVLASGANLVISKLKALWSIVEGLADILIGAFTLDEERILKGFNSVLGGLKTIFKGVFNLISSPFIQAFNFIQDKFNAFMGPIKDGINWVANKLGFSNESEEKAKKTELKTRKIANIDEAYKAFANANSIPSQAEMLAKGQAITGNSTVSNAKIESKTSNVNNNINITVNASGDASEIGNAVAENLRTVTVANQQSSEQM